MKPLEIVAVARETLGTPYGYQQRVNGLAMDCAGVPIFVANRLGITVETRANYGLVPQPAAAREILDNTLVRVRIADMQPGDVAWIRFEREPQHIGIVGDYVHGGLSLIHAYNGAGPKRVTEHRLDPTWMARIVAVWRFPGVEA